MSDVLWSFDYEAAPAGSDAWQAVIDWLKSQGLDPDVMPCEELSIVEAPDGLLLCYSTVLLDESGQPVYCGHGGGDEHVVCIRKSKIVNSLPLALWLEAS